MQKIVQSKPARLLALAAGLVLSTLGASASEDTAASADKFKYRVLLRHLAVTAPNAPVEVHPQGYRSWPDDSFAASCLEYRKPGPKPYKGASESGIYRIEPAGEAPVDVWCDMATDGGGWTLIGKFTNWLGPHVSSRALMLPGSPLSGFSDTGQTHPAYVGPNVFSELRYATTNATWNARYGVTVDDGIKLNTWPIWPTITQPTDWVVNATRLDGSSSPALALISLRQAAWWDLRESAGWKEGESMEFSLFTAPSSNGDCGGASISGSTRICMATANTHGYDHFDVTSAKWLWGR